MVRKFLFCLMAVMLVLSPMGIRPALAEDPQPETPAEAKANVLSAEIDAQYGPRTIVQVTMELDTAQASCDGFPGITIDPNSAGPLGANSQTLIVVQSALDPETNVACTRIGSRWAGMPGKTQRLWGFLTVHSKETGNLVGQFYFDGQNDPTGGTPLIVDTTPWSAPRDGKQYDFHIEINLVMLPDNVGPSTLKADWSFFTYLNKMYLPVIMNPPPAGFNVTWWCGSGQKSKFVPFSTDDTTDPVHLGCLADGTGTVAYKTIIRIWSDYQTKITIRAPLYYEVSWNETRPEWQLYGFDRCFTCDPIHVQAAISHIVTVGAPGIGLGSISFTYDPPPGE